MYRVILFNLIFLLYLSASALFARENQKKDKQYDDLLIGVHFGAGWTQINLNRVDNPETSNRKETRRKFEGLRSTVGYFLGYMPIQDFMIMIGGELDNYKVKNQEKYNEDETITPWYTFGMRYYFLCENCYASISVRYRIAGFGTRGSGYSLSFAKELWLSDYFSVGVGFFYNYTRREYSKLSSASHLFTSYTTIYETETREDYYGVQLTVAYDL